MIIKLSLFIVTILLSLLPLFFCPTYFDVDLLPKVVESFTNITLDTNYPYDPAQHGVPSTLGEYTVLAIYTPQDIACMPAGYKRIVLQARQGNVYDFLEYSETPIELLKQLPDTETRWQVSVVGPGATLEEIQANVKSWNAQFENRPCMNLGGPVPTVTPTRMAVN